MADPPDVDSRLRLARQVLSPSDEHRLRVRSALAARLAAEAPAAPIGHVARAGRPIASRRVARALEAAALVATGFVLGVWFSEAGQPGAAAPVTDGVAADRDGMAGAPPRPGETPPARAVPSRESATPSPAAEPAVALSPSSGTALSGTSSDISNEPSRPAKSSGTRGSERAHARAAPRATTADDLAGELALLRRAERATRSGDAVLARSLLAELDARFPKTALRQERTALLVLVACATDEPTAQDEARAFIERHAQSVHLDRVRSACKLDSLAAAGLPVRSAGSTPK